MNISRTRQKLEQTFNIYWIFLCQLSMLNFDRKKSVVISISNKEIFRKRSRDSYWTAHYIWLRHFRSVIMPTRYSTRADFRGNDQHNFHSHECKKYNDVTFEEFIFYYYSFIYLYVYLLIVRFNLKIKIKTSLSEM